MKETKSGTRYVQTTVASNLVYPVGVAVDGAGNVFIADQDAETVVEASPINGGYSQTTVFTGLGNVESVAVDGSGNVYIGSLLVGLVKETLTNGTYTQSTINSRVYANALAVDGNGVLYVSQGNSNILAETPSNGGYTETTAVSGLSFPRGLSVDGLGNLYIADYSLGVIYKELPLQFGGFLQSTAVSGFDSLETVAVDGDGNLYFATNYFASSNPGVFKKDNFDPPSLHFATTAPGQTSSDSPQTVTFVNVGNGTLQFGGTSPQALNPTISTGFDVDASSTCFPNPGSATEVSGLGPLTSCIYQVSFKPPYGGPSVRTMVVADNNLNTLSPSQTIPLNGTGTGTALPVVTSVSPNSGPSGGNTSVVITGLDLAGASSVQFGSVPATSFLVNSATSISAVSPPGTSTMMTVTTPDGTSATSANDLYTYTSTTQVIQFNAPTSSFAGTSVLLQATGGASGNPVVFSVVSGPAMVSGTNGSTLTYTAPGTVVVEAVGCGRRLYGRRASPDHPEPGRVDGTGGELQRGDLHLGDLSDRRHTQRHKDLHAGCRRSRFFAGGRRNLQPVGRLCRRPDLRPGIQLYAHPSRSTLWRSGLHRGFRHSARHQLLLRRRYRTPSHLSSWHPD